MRFVHVFAVFAAFGAFVASTQSVQRGELGVWAVFIVPFIAIFGVYAGCVLIIGVTRNKPIGEWGTIAKGLFESKGKHDV